MKKKLNNPFISKEERLKLLKEIFQSEQPNKVSSDRSRIDLHLHTNYSDGYWTPAGLVYNIWKEGIKVFSLTDHDGFAGVDEVFDATELCNSCTKADITFIPGIEISTNYFQKVNGEKKKKEIHILGYWPGVSKESFHNILTQISPRDSFYFEAFRNNRIMRIFEMVRIFNYELPKKIPALNNILNVHHQIISDKTVVRGLRNSISPGRLLTSTGIFQVCDLYRKGRLNEIEDEAFGEDYLKLLDEAFSGIDAPKKVMQEFFDKKQPSAKTGYIGLTESPQWAVNLINKLGGLSVLAHPTRYWEVCEKLIPELLSVDLDGIEIYSEHCKSAQQLLELRDEISHKFPTLLHTVGSDCHGFSIEDGVDYSPSKRLGCSPEIGSIVPEEKIIKALVL